MKKKTPGLLHVVPYFDGADAYGGIPRVAAGQVWELSNRGYEVTVCTTDARDADRRHPASKKSIMYNKSKVHYFKNMSNGLAYRQIFLPLKGLAWLWDNVCNFDVVHLHGYRNLLNEVAATAARKHRIPYVIQANGTVPRIERKKTVKLLYDLVIARKTMQGCSMAIAVSEAERSQYVQAGLDPARVALVPNGLDPAEFKDLPSRSESRRKLGIGPGEKIIAFLGKATPRKGIDTLVKAVSSLKPDYGLRLVISGSDMGGVKPALQLAARLGIESRIAMLGPVEGKERLSLLVAADVSVYAGRDEIFGISAFESIMCGTPVIVASDSGCGEWAKKTGCPWLIRPGDAVALAEWIERILGEPSKAGSTVRLAREFVKRELSWGQVTDSLEKVYIKALEIVA
ncbi:MAG: glycosyltransferase [Deltaproteobacteria bacterium]|nr:glycosyltransferase [Deltaproteobacteria bacterium]